MFELEGVKNLCPCYILLLIACIIISQIFLQLAGSFSLNGFRRMLRIENIFKSSFFLELLPLGEGAGIELRALYL